jgi:hypothetical protein
MSYKLSCVLQELGWKRSDLVISTKIFWGGDGPNDKGLSRKHIIEGTKVRSCPGLRAKMCICMGLSLIA